MTSVDLKPGEPESAEQVARSIAQALRYLRREAMSAGLSELAVDLGATAAEAESYVGGGVDERSLQRS